MGPLASQILAAKALHAASLVGDTTAVTVPALGESLERLLGWRWRQQKRPGVRDLGL